MVQLSDANFAELERDGKVTLCDEMRSTLQLLCESYVRDHGPGDNPTYKGVKKELRRAHKHIAKCKKAVQHLVDNLDGTSGRPLGSDARTWSLEHHAWGN